MISQTLAGEEPTHSVYKIQELVQGLSAQPPVPGIHSEQVLLCIKVCKRRRFAMARELAPKEGIYGHLCTGANVARL